MTATMRSGEVAAAAGVNLQTLRYYERRGLLAEPDRSLGGHRMYPPDTVTVLRVIKAAQRLGFTLEEVAELLAAGRHAHASRPHEGAPQAGRNTPHRPTAGLQDRASTKLAEVEARIADLVVIRDTLRAALRAGCDDLVACAESPCCPLPFSDLARPSRVDP
jgi:MerR family mercuric resistance operon transcriptional regulator